MWPLEDGDLCETRGGGRKLGELRTISTPVLCAKLSRRAPVCFCERGPANRQAGGAAHRRRLWRRGCGCGLGYIPSTIGPRLPGPWCCLDDARAHMRHGIGYRGRVPTWPLTGVAPRVHGYMKRLWASVLVGTRRNLGVGGHQLGAIFEPKHRWHAGAAGGQTRARCAVDAGYTHAPHIRLRHHARCVSFGRRAKSYDMFQRRMPRLKA